MLLVGVDGDDTLWHNDRHFSMSEDRFRTLVAPFADGADLDARLLDTERANLSLLGYGAKAFTLAMIETAITVSNGRVPTSVIAELVEAGKQMHAHPVELLDGVPETVAALAGRWELVLVTKGDLFHQESKVARSGLAPLFARVEIVSEKDPDTYRRILAAAGVAAADFVMVGDSLRSDVAAVLDMGARAVHVPGPRARALEHADLAPPGDGRWWRVNSIRAVPALLGGLDQPRSSALRISAT